MDWMAGGSGRSTTSEKKWVVDMRNTLKDADPTTEMEQWTKLSIYRVPDCIRELNPKAYKPQLVSLGPFHHGDPNLLPMEDDKRRALVHLLRRAGKPLEEFWVAMEEVVEQLEGAYLDLGDEWRGGNRDQFLELMITDGCFLLEVMRTAAPGRSAATDYAPNDPIFSMHGILYTLPYIKRDMLMIENQIPLLVLERLVAVESGKPKNDDLINKMVLKFLSPNARPLAPSVGLGLHPLDVYRKSLLIGSPPVLRAPPEAATSDIIRSAVELYEAGIRFKKSKSESLHDIRFQHGVLRLPMVSVDDSTEYMFLNLMAFERLHVGAGNDVTAYVFFMDNMIDSAKDVNLLTSKGIIQNMVGSDKAVAKLFNSLCRDVVLESGGRLDDVHRQVNAYYRKPWNMWRANLIHTYFRSPWAFLSLAAAIFLLVMTVLQTVYSVLSYVKPASSS